MAGFKVQGLLSLRVQGFSIFGATSFQVVYCFVVFNHIESDRQ